MSLSVIVPSKGRPANVARLIEAYNKTAYYEGDEHDRLVIAIDRDEPMIEEYKKAVPFGNSWDWVELVQVDAFPQRMGPVLNRVALVEAHRDGVTHVGFMGDDHVPRTQRWDGTLVGSLGDRPGVAYGNDLIQGDRLPTACIVSADIVRILGYMVPPGLMHLYMDDYWKMLGAAVGNLVYRHDVVVEHWHPTAGKAVYDEHYLENNSGPQYTADHASYSIFLATQWPHDYDKLRRELNLG